MGLCSVHETLWCRVGVGQLPPAHHVDASSAKESNDVEISWCSHYVHHVANVTAQFAKHASYSDVLWPTIHCFTVYVDVNQHLQKQFQQPLVCAAHINMFIINMPLRITLSLKALHQQ